MREMNHIEKTKIHPVTAEKEGVLMELQEAQGTRENRPGSMT